MRKLNEYYHFNIDVSKGWARFTDIFGNDLPQSKSKLTSGQWIRAKEYLTRELIPFQGYDYKVKEAYKNKDVIKIR